jgi:hypothetical protein
MNRANMMNRALGYAGLFATIAALAWLVLR